MLEKVDVMGKKIFVSYKYADDQVNNLESGENSTVRDYVDEFERIVDSSEVLSITFTFKNIIR